MNVLLISFVAAGVLARAFEFPELPWLGIVIVGFLGTYLGCYFWLLSDGRIVRIP
jgi:hypothetical protein